MYLINRGEDMKYHSTRGNRLVSGSEAIVNGIAEDGGLYVPEYIPHLDYKELIDLDYVELATKIVGLYFTDFKYEDIKSNLSTAYSKFDIKETVRLEKCDDSYFLELFHGPTLAFKDLALVALPRLMVMAKKQLGSNENITIITATSGDTGGAALSGFKDVPGISIIVLYPNGGVSSVQEAQMQSFTSDNAKVIAVEGNFDDCQSFVKNFFLHNSDLNLSSANSINIARLVPQIVYYFYSYLELVRNKEINMGDRINYSVPTGNFGNILAGFMAREMGLPINKLICSSNENDVLTEFFETGTYNKNRSFFKTNSPSMDILISSNLERYLYFACDGNTDMVSDLMTELYANGSYKFKNPYDYVLGFKTNQSKTLEVIKNVYDKYKYLIDPHTAVAYNGYVKLGENIKTVVVSTASAFKFPQSILEAFGYHENDSIDNVKKISNLFNLEIPKVLNYSSFNRVEKNLTELEEYMRSLIKCFK